jgi:DNA gyrase inhibitor GyrI
MRFFRRERERRGSLAQVLAAVQADWLGDLLGLEAGVIPGGLYARQRLEGGPENIAVTFAAMAREFTQDPSRPCIEFYRRHDEVILFLPVVAD